MQIKSGTIGYVKLNTKWFKCIVLGQVGVTLAVRVAPQLYGQLVHGEQFISENKFNSLGYTGSHRFSWRHRIWNAIECKIEYCKYKLSLKGRKRFELEGIVFAGTIGWAKIYSRGLIFFRKRWRRCLVLKHENSKLTLCCSPNLSIVRVYHEDFLAVDIESKMRVKKHEHYW